VAQKVTLKLLSSQLPNSSI